MHDHVPMGTVPGSFASGFYEDLHNMSPPLYPPMSATHTAAFDAHLTIAPTQHEHIPGPPVWHANAAVSAGREQTASEHSDLHMLFLSMQNARQAHPEGRSKGRTWDA